MQKSVSTIKVTPDIALTIVVRPPVHCMHLKTCFLLLVLSLLSVQSKLTGRHDQPRRNTGLLIPIVTNKRPRVMPMTMMKAIKLRSSKVKILRKTTGWFLELATLMKGKNLVMLNK